MSKFDPKVGVKIGDRVRWTSAEGDIRGEIVSMRLGLNAANEVIPWLTIECMRYGRLQHIDMCGLESHLRMMKFVVIFRDGGYREVA